MGGSPASIDDYLDGLDAAPRAELERLRALVTRLVPEVEESITYRMPTLSYRGRALVYLTASKKHLSLYPSSWAIEEHADRLADFATTEHAIRFTVDRPLPTDLVEDLVRYHARQIEADRH